jgi:hypothetical protein
MHLTLIFSVLLLVFPVHHLFSAYLTIIFLYTLLKDSGVIALLHFFSKWLLWAITLPFKLLLGAALRLGNLKMQTPVIFLFLSLSDWFVSFFLWIFWGGGSAPSLCRQFTNTFTRMVT